MSNSEMHGGHNSTWPSYLPFDILLAPPGYGKVPVLNGRLLSLTIRVA